MSSADSLLARFGPNERWFISGCSGEPRPLVEAIAAADLPALEITNSFLPGINPVTLCTNDNALTEVAFFPRPGDSRPGAVRVLPTSYYGAWQYILQQRFDGVVVQVSAPNAIGECSLGTSVEFAPAALKGAGKVMGIVNHAMPALPGTPTVPLSRLDHTAEVDWPLVTYDPGPTDAASTQIAQYVSALIPDGAALQLGIGRVPASLLEQLTQTRNLRLYSGLVSEGFIQLADSGVLDATARHVGCTALGSSAFYRWLAERDDLSLCGVDQSHNPATLAGLENFIALNSALEVDLLGQANLETAGGRAVSGIGGSPDFCRGARCSPGGKSIIALPATARNGSVSRIVATLPAGQPASLGRQDIDYVVTEYGVADLTHKSAIEKAEALIAVAAPGFQADLLDTLGRN